jgi:hypothetical protein
MCSIEMAPDLEDSLGNLFLPGFQTLNDEAPDARGVCVGLVPATLLLLLAALAPSAKNPSAAQATAAAHPLPRNVMISSTGPVGGLPLLVPAPPAAVQERADAGVAFDLSVTAVTPFPTHARLAAIVPAVRLA